MALTLGDRLIGYAVRFLYDGKEDDAADILLQCSLEYMATGTLSNEFLITISGPRLAYDVLTRTDDKLTRSIKRAITAALPPNRYAAEPEIDSWLVRAGIVTRDPTTQAELLQLARGSDTPAEVVEAMPIKPQQQPMLVTPIPILPVAWQKRDPNLCFVIMPFAPAFRPVYDYAIRPAVQAAGLECRRADDIMQPGDIMAQVWQSLLQASLVIADLTGVNGNVFYELGLAHVLGHQAILLTQNRADIPFDLQRQRYIEYQPAQQGVQELRASLELALRHAHATVK